MMYEFHKKQKIIIAMIGSMLIIAVLYYIYTKEENENVISAEENVIENIIADAEESEETTKEEINKIIVHVSGAVNKEGIVELEENSRIADAISQAEGLKEAAIRKAEGEKEAAIRSAEGEKQAEILRAEGIAQARIIEADAEKEAINRIITALADKGQPDKYLIAMKYLETMTAITSGENNKVVYMPYEATGILSSVDGIKEMFKGTTK